MSKGTTVDRTIDPVQEGPEFARADTIKRMFGIGRGTLYNMADMGLIKSVRLRVRGQKQGLRLWHVQSIRDHLYKLMEGQ